jgi:YHS domain-containing protein
MGALLDLLVFLVISRAVWMFLGGVAAGLNQPRQPAASSSQSPASGPQPPTAGIHMARDPVCGTFVVPGRAIELVSGSERIYFCSVECRDKFRGGSRPAAVGGRTA